MSLGFSSLVLSIIVGLVVYLWVSDHKHQPPILQVTTAEIRKTAEQYYVPFTVANAGGNTAESVQVIAELRIDGTIVEAGEQTINFLSSQEKVEGAFIFTQDPQQAHLTVRVASYKKP
ncbi:MAG: TIGR02588 family protein [Cyanobacteria bacterium P01_A01_bin.17]